MSSPRHSSPQPQHHLHAPLPLNPNWQTRATTSPPTHPRLRPLRLNQRRPKRPIIRLQALRPLPHPPPLPGPNNHLRGLHRTPILRHLPPGDGQTARLRLLPPHRTRPLRDVIEIGHVIYSPLLQRTVAATELQYLLARRAFGAGYRRLEWKFDAQNLASGRAALRLGFEFEGGL